MTKAPRKKKPPITHGRPPLHKTKKPLSSKTTRSIIRNHHALSKRKTQAVGEGNERLAESIEQQISENGGLSLYQLASAIGQSADRGGDSSKVLVSWLRPAIEELSNSSEKLRILEVGALSTKNACSRVAAFHVDRIDLHAQEAGIVCQDFMKRPLPTIPEDGYHVISLSLVLNFVPDPNGRGDMLRRLPKFLSDHQEFSDVLPCVFLVLPAPCVENSRYLTEDRLNEMMGSIGFSCIEWKRTPKLVYSLWKHNGPEKKARFKKEELRSGAKRNNFAIVL